MKVLDSGHRPALPRGMPPSRPALAGKKHALDRTFLTFEAGGIGFAMAMEHVEGIERGGHLTPEATPTGPTGLLLSAADTLAYDLPSLLGQDPCQLTDGGTGKRILLLESSEGQWGLQVDRILGTHPAGEGELHPLPMAAHYAQTRLPYAGVLVRALDHGEKLFLVLEPEALHPQAHPLSGVEDLCLPRPSVTAPHSALAFLPGFAPSTGSGPRIFLFRLDYDGPSGPMLCGLSLQQVVEVVETTPWTPLPGSPDHILGLIPWRGRPLALLDPLRRWDLGQTPAKACRHYLVARLTGGDLLALPLVGEQSIQALPLPTSPTTKEAANLPHLLGCFALEDSTLLIPDLQGLVG